MLKLKDNVDLKELEKFDFLHQFPYTTDFSDDYEFDNKMFYQIGHSRRGQFYYILVDKTSLEISVYATRPDGSGTSIGVGSILFDLIQAGLVEKVE